MKLKHVKVLESEEYRLTSWTGNPVGLTIGLIYECVVAEWNHEGTVLIDSFIVDDKGDLRSTSAARLGGFDVYSELYKTNAMVEGSTYINGDKHYLIRYKASNGKYYQVWVGKSGLRWLNK